MRTRALLVVVIAGALLAGGLSLRGGAAAATRKQPRAIFVAKLPEIGTVYARTYCTGDGPLRFALGIHYLEMGQSGVVRFRAGRFSRDREMQPGDPTAWFPYRRDRVEWLAAAAGGENGVVVGWVRVIGRSAHSDTCQSSYGPLRVTVQTYPRSFDYDRGSARYLRRLIG
jgi:hypothetical protein